MPVKLDHEANNLYVLQITGVFRRDEFEATQEQIGKEIDRGAEPRVLVNAEGFGGWETGQDWHDLELLLPDRGEITKIAIIADPRWKVRALAFAGSRVRSAPAKFFPPTEVAQARTWLAA